MPVCGEIGLSERLQLEVLRGKWHEIFGEAFARHSYPVSIEKGDLLVNVDSPLWLQELKFSRTDIEKRLKAFSVDAVRFRHGRTFWTSGHKKNDCSQRRNACSRSEIVGCTSEEAAWIEEFTETISDPELRCTVRKTVEKALAKRSPRRPA